MDLYFIIRIIIVGCDLVNKGFFVITGTRRLFKIKRDMNVDKKYLLYNSENSQLKTIEKQKWTFSSMTKFILNKIIVLLYFSFMIIYFLDTQESLMQTLTFNVYCIISCITWLISTRLFYKEYRLYKDQTWSGIRIFWIINNILNISHLVYIYFDENYSDFFNKNIIRLALFGCICFISLLLFLLAIFHPYDVSLEKTNKEGEKNVDDNATRLSTEVQDDLLFNSEDEFTNDGDISFHNLETILVELNDSDGFNTKQYSIELKIKTQDFKQLIFSVKIQKIKHKRSKLPINVSNFNEIILKYYKNKYITKDLLNLLKQAYNISLTLNPQRNSFTGDKKNTNLLAHLYREIIKKDYQFLLDLLIFLKIKSDDLIKDLKENYTSIYDENPSVEKDIERIDTLGSIFDNFDDIGFIDINSSNVKKLKTLEDKFPKSDKKVKSKDYALEIKDPINLINSARTPAKRNVIAKDYTSFSSFLNNILINKRFLTIKIISYEEIPQNLNFMIKSISDKNEVILQLNTDILHDILYDDELASYIIDNTYSINDKKSNVKQTIEELFNAYLNNIFYYDEKLYNLFNLNEFIKLDMEKFNNEIIQKFFEEKKTNLGTIKNDIREYIFEIKLKNFKDNKDIKPLINEGILEIELSKKNEEEKIINKNKVIKCKIKIIKLYLIIEKMILIINTKNKYKELISALNNIKIFSGKLLNIIYNIEEDHIKNVKNFRIKGVLYGDKKINAIVDEFEKRYNETKIVMNKVNQELINDINSEIKNLNTYFNSVLNKPDLKYSLYYTYFRDLIEFSSLF